jgi:O-antigen/teichoic acid export membrane protein
MINATPWARLRAASPFAANALLTGGSNILLALLGLVSGIWAARLLGPNGRGELAAIQTIPSVVANLAMLGMPEAIVYFSARQPSEAGRYLASALIVALISSLPALVAGYLLVPLFLHAQRPEIVSTARWYLVSIVPLYALVGMLAHPFRGRKDFAVWNVTRFLPSLAWIAVLAIAWVYNRGFPGFLAAGHLVALAVVFIPLAALVLRHIPGPFTPDLSKSRSMVRYGLPCMMTGMPQMLNLRLDQMLMAALLPPRELGLYAVAVAWSGGGTPLLSALGAVTTPTVASATDREQQARRLAFTARATAVLALILSLAIVAATPVAIVVLFGEKFRGSVAPALILVPANAVLGINQVIQEGLRGMGHPFAALQAELAGLLVTVIALAATLRPLGGVGAAISSLIGYSTVGAVLLLNARRHANTPVSQMLSPQLGEIKVVFNRLAATWSQPGD